MSSSQLLSFASNYTTFIRRRSLCPDWISGHHSSEYDPTRLVDLHYAK